MGIAKRKEELNESLNLLYNKIYEFGIINGYNKGYDDGFEDGYLNRTEESKGAISDGLRQGSKKCAKEMNKLKFIKKKK